MPVFLLPSKAPSVADQPQIALERWCLFELPGRTRHFCGYDPDPDKPGRVSSPIQRFDPTTMTGITRSGRIYWLKGPQGTEDEATALMTPWLFVNGLMFDDATFVEPEAFGRPVH